MAEFNQNFFERGMDYIQLFNEQDCNSDVTGDWVKMTHYDRALILIQKFGSEDVDTLGFQFLQATSNGGSSKGINLSRFWYKQGTMTAQTVWTFNQLTTADDIVGIGSAAPSGGSLVNATDVDTSAFCLAADMPVDALDIANGYAWFTVKGIGAEVDNSCKITASVILMGGRFAGNVPLSAIS